MKIFKYNSYLKKAKTNLIINLKINMFIFDIIMSLP